MPWLDWYNSLAKPSWTPAPATIGLIWQILYRIILVSFGFVFVQAKRELAIKAYSRQKKESLIQATELTA